MSPDTPEQQSTETWEIEVPGPDTPEGALWRELLADADPPYIYATEKVSLIHPGKSDALARPELNRRNPNAVNHQVGWWAVDSLANTDPELRRAAAEALQAVLSYEEPGLARAWVMYQSSSFAFLCTFSPGENVRLLGRRFAILVPAVQRELSDQ